ncbi:MAG: N-acetylglucosamine-6-phosphate deacetylase [Candidatus Hydrogenedentes bacterium]|nr:N-acetylglucosamine-6-phosphate deacetylase [Candidatus Hydrogenedentota bacterium]
MITSPLPTRHTGPGLVDLQVNGYAGIDFNGADDVFTPETFHMIREKMNSRGVLVSLPTYITASPARLESNCRAYAKLVEADAELAAAFPKLHIEGPFISSVEGPRGAHPLEHAINPADAPDLMARLQEASGGRLGIITLAPELPGALDLIAWCRDNGIVSAAGHTNATSAEIRAGAEAGLVMSTHLGNGSHQMLPRMDNYIQAQLAEDGLFASFIADGHHVPFFTLKNFIRAKRFEKTVLVSDAIMAADCGPGRYQLGDFEVEVSETLRCTKVGHAGLAGSALTMDLGVINTALHTDANFEEAWTMASTRPAQLVGIPVPADITVEVSEAGFSLAGTASPCD